MPKNEVLRKSLPLDPEVLRKSGKSSVFLLHSGYWWRYKSTRAFTTSAEEPPGA